MKALNELSVAEVAKAIKSGQTTSEAVVCACLERIGARENVVGAWQCLEPDMALEQARDCDRKEANGLLHGVPIAVKDIIETQDMPTCYGSEIYEENFTNWDAACVTLVREAGAVIMGKSVTTEFAAFSPGKTANPRNLRHTPGGSSSGSAAAVADYMVPAGFATQTAASIIRPAAFCGVIGYKPSYGSFSLAGIKTFAESVDTLGTITRSVEDAKIMRAALLAIPLESNNIPQINSLKIGLCQTHQWDEADEYTHDAIEGAAETLAAAGAKLCKIELPLDFANLVEVHKTIMSFEGARNYAFERLNHGARLSDGLNELLEIGAICSYNEYLEACAHAERCRRLLNSVFDDVDLLLTPSARGEAPEGLTVTGDPIFSRMWTLLHVPSITIPVSLGSLGLPIGAQFVARYQSDDSLLRMTQTIDGVLR